MKTTLTKDARGFVDGVVDYIRNEGRSKSSIPKVEAFLGKVTAQAKKEKMAHVASSVLLTEKEKEMLQSTLARILGHVVDLQCSVDDRLIAGLNIQVGDWVVDTSLKSQLEEMAKQLQQ